MVIRDSRCTYCHATLSFEDVVCPNCQRSPMPTGVAWPVIALLLLVAAAAALFVTFCTAR